MYSRGAQEFIEIEMRRLEEDVRFNSELNSDVQDTGFEIFGLHIGAELQCFRGSNLKRTLTAMFGASFVIGYATYFFELIGISNFFLASCLMYVVMLLSTTAAFPLVEIVGRRGLIVPALFAMSGLLLLMGILGWFQDKSGALWAIVVITYLWAVVYQVSLGACGFVLASEVATLRLRAATQALVTVMNGVWGLIMQFTVPYMISTDAGNLGGKTGLIFFGTGILTAIAGYFLFPETKVYGLVYPNQLPFVALLNLTISLPRVFLLNASTNFITRALLQGISKRNLPRWIFQWHLDRE
jgi:hypothetical protein